MNYTFEADLIEDGEHYVAFAKTKEGFATVKKSLCKHKHTTPEEAMTCEDAIKKMSEITKQ